MRIDVDHLKSKAGVGEDYNWKLEPPKDFKESLKDIWTCMTATYTGEGIVFLKGTINLKFTTTCSRCMQSVSVDVCHQFEEEFRKGLPPEDEKELELTKRELSFDYFTGKYLELGDYFRQLILLAIPEKVVCSEDCLGLCPECGKDLNEGKCNCQQDTVDPRLKKLEEFKSKLD